MTRALVVAAACALALAAAAAADSTDPRVKLTKADQASASATVLRPSDLGPAWTGGAIAPTSLKAPICPGNIPNDRDLTITGHAESTLTLAGVGIQVDTDVEVFRSKAQVAKLVARTMGKSITGCLEYNLLKSPAFGSGGATLRSIRELRVAKAGDRSRLFRIEIGVKPAGSKQAVVVYADFLFVSRGRTQAFVNVIAPSSEGSALTPLESQIAATLARRAPA